MKDVILISRCTKINDRLTELFGLYLKFYGHSILDHEMMAKFLMNNLNNNSVIAVAKIGNNDHNICGFVQMYFIPNSLSLGKMCILNDLFVDENERGNGIGKMLMDYVSEFCRNNNVDRMELSTSIDNSMAQSLYLNCGWKRIENFQYYERSAQQDDAPERFAPGDL